MIEDPIAISALEHFMYCPRQCALIHVDGVWVENEFTVGGQRGHRRADTPGARIERGRQVVRAVPLWSEGLGLTGRADVIEVHNNGSVVPVEFKTGRRHGDAAHVQLCAQALCLEEMLGLTIERGLLWFTGPRRRVEVLMSTDLRRMTAQVISEVHAQRDTRKLPAPVNDERCDHCQLLAHCMPDLVAEPMEIDVYLEREVFRCVS